MRRCGQKACLSLNIVFDEQTALGWTNSRAVPLVNVNGEILEWFGVASDVTARAVVT